MHLTPIQKKKRQAMRDMIQTAAKHYGREEREGLWEEWEFCDFLSRKAATHGKQNTSGRGQKGPWGSFRHHSAELDLTHKRKKQHRRSVHGKASTLPLMPCSIKTHFPHPENPPFKQILLHNRRRFGGEDFVTLYVLQRINS